MTLSRRRFISITAGVAASGIGAAIAPVPAETATWRGVALGADAKLVVTGLPRPEADRLIAMAGAEIERLENIFSVYRPQSSLSALNATGILEMPPPELLSLLSIADSIHAASGGMFDPTIQPLWRVYAEHKGQPPRALMREAAGLVGWQHVRSDAGFVKFEKANIALTLNGIAQGFITDRITRLLKSEGLSSAVVKLGEIAAVGHDQRNEPWQIGIAKRGDEPAEEFVALADQAIATSSAVGTTFDGTTSHIIDPGSGLPARSRWQRVSVIHPSAAIADGLSTAAILMDRDRIGDMIAQTTNVQLIAKSANGDRYSMASRPQS